MRGRVTKSYKRPYENPMAVSAGDPVIPDFKKLTDMEGWLWCTAEDGRSGWTPESWLVLSDGKWQLSRDYNAIELTVAPGEMLEITIEESGFFWAQKVDGEGGWVPCDHVAIVGES